MLVRFQPVNIGDISFKRQKNAKNIFGGVAINIANDTPTSLAEKALGFLYPLPSAFFLRLFASVTVCVCWPINHTVVVEKSLQIESVLIVGLF